jgi:hypothetical protein
MERRTTSRKDWVIGKDDVGRAILEWRLGPEQDPGTTDPCARTHDFLERLDVPELTLEDDSPARGSFNPYDQRPSFPSRDKWRRG